MMNERYFQLLYMTMITFKTASMANITITNEKPGAIVRGTENNHLSLECLLDGGKTNKTMFWKQNDKILEVGRNGNVTYSFVPMKKDHLSKFHCVVIDINNLNTTEKVVTLDIKYKPVLKFNYPDESYFIKGQTNRLCCSSDSRPSTKTMMLLIDETVITEAHHNNSICLTIRHKCDFDGGKYSCFAENELGMVKQEINITISCPPVFLEENKIVQFGKLGENITLKVVVHTVSSIECCRIEGENRRQIPPEMLIIPKNTTPLVPDTDITTKELEITFSFTELQTSDYQKYNITVCNHDGNSSCIVELKPMNTEFGIPHAQNLSVILLSLLTIILLVAGMVFALVKRLKNERIKTPDDVVEVVEGTSSGNIHTNVDCPTDLSCITNESFSIFTIASKLKCYERNEGY